MQSLCINICVLTNVLMNVNELCNFEIYLERKILVCLRCVRTIKINLVIQMLSIFFFQEIQINCNCKKKKKLK